MAEAAAGSQLDHRSSAVSVELVKFDTPSAVLPGNTWDAPNNSRVKQQQQQQQPATSVVEFGTPPQRDFAWDDSGPNEAAATTTNPSGGIGAQLSRLFRRRGRSSEKVRSFHPLEKSSSVGSGSSGGEQRRRAWEEGDSGSVGGGALETESSNGAISVGQRLAEKLRLASRRRL